ncbi:flagellar biosynthesis anti-sigma factor FlgM [Sporosarcina gallistercoris]|uniref:Negative regulator of flagellin synthesis n=1 Tax=Sporosarcina gallistercoris TaxID=2762245 RepID=A0ABR8PN44_9BACL|nr:flagellar biosynthesis anti-sigma factor FlgM [Sporosarcina gallistercoris]MBD7909600.1 flagellar biosynthesis anti-sigma factor FlgM [Sporosarcina gallistercoris]
MKITNNNIQPVNPYRANQVKNEQTKNETAIQKDRLEISNEAKQLSEPSPITAQRNDKVSALKAQIQAGTYKVDAEQLASDLIGYYQPKL